MDEVKNLQSFGLAIPEQDQPQDSQEEERGELEEQVDTSEEEIDEVEGEYLDSEDTDDAEDDDEAEEEDVDFRKLQKKILHQEKKLREYQSKSDKLEHENTQLNQDNKQILEYLKEIVDDKKANNDLDDDLDLGFDDDEHVPYSEVKEKLKGKQTKKKEAEELKKYKEAIDGEVKRQKASLDSINQDEYKKVSDYVQGNNSLREDKTFLQQVATLDEAGRFYAVKAKMLEERIKELESSSKKKRGKVPPTGGKQPRGGSPKKSSSFASSIDKLNGLYQRYGMKS